MRYLLIILFFIPFTSRSQTCDYTDVEYIAYSGANKLIESGEADQVLIYIPGCVGCFYLDNEGCECEYFLFWIHDEKLWAQDFSECKPEKNELTNKSFWEFLMKNKEDVFNSEFKEDIILSHYHYDQFKLIPYSNKSITIKEYHLMDENSFKDENMKLKAYSFMQLLKKTIHNYQGK